MMGGIFSKQQPVSGRHQQNPSNGSGKTGTASSELPNKGAVSKATTAKKSSATDVSRAEVVNGPKTLGQLLSGSHRDAWVPRFRDHLSDTEKSDLPKQQWRANLLNFVLTLHDLRDVLKSQKDTRDKLVKRGASTTKPLRRSSSSSSSDEEVTGQRTRLENAQNKKRELCEKLQKEHFGKKKVAIFDTKVRDELASLLKEHIKGGGELSEKDKVAGDARLFEVIEKVIDDEKVWRALSDLCDKYFDSLLKSHGSTFKDVQQSVLMCLL